MNGDGDRLRGTVVVSTSAEISMCPSCMYSPRLVLRDLRCALTGTSGTSDSACALSDVEVFDTKTGMGGPINSRDVLDFVGLIASFTRS